MKKWVSHFKGIALMSIFLLGACTEDETEEPGNEEQEVTPEDEIDVEGLVGDIQEAVANVESYSVRINFLQSFDEEGLEEVLAGMDFDVIIEPAQMLGDLSINDQVSGDSATLDLYATQEEAYFKTSEVGYWRPDEDVQAEEIVSRIFQQDLELLLEQSENVDIEESGGAYILRLSLDENQTDDLSLSVMVPYILGDVTTLLGQVEIENTDDYIIEEFEYELRVDKETFLPIESDSTVSGEFVHPDVTGDFEQEMRHEMLGWDNVEEIEPPDDLDYSFESAWEHEIGGDPADEEYLAELADIAQSLESYVLHDVTDVEYRGDGFVEEQTIELLYEVLADHTQGHINVDVRGQIENASMDIYLDEEVLYYREDEEAYQELPNDLTELGMNQEVPTLVSTASEISEYLYEREEDGKYILTYEGEDPEVFQAFLEPLAMESSTQDRDGFIRLYMVFDEETGYLENMDVEMEFVESGFTMFVEMQLEVSDYNEVEPAPIPDEVLEDVNG